MDGKNGRRENRHFIVFFCGEVPFLGTGTALRDKKCYNDMTTQADINKLYHTLQIQPKQCERPQKSYGANASFEKCGITVHIPTTVTNSTTLDVKTTDSDKNRKSTAGF